MVVMTLQLSPDHKPFLGVSNQRAVEMLAEALSDAVQQALDSGNEEFLRHAKEYATGRSCVGVIWTTEPPARIVRGT